MQVIIKSQFEKQFFKFNDPHLSAKVYNIVLAVEKAIRLTDIKNLKKLKGHKTVYRIRCGSYRIGIVFETEIVYFAAIGLRDKFYTTFP